MRSCSELVGPRLATPSDSWYGPLRSNVLDTHNLHTLIHKYRAAAFCTGHVLAYRQRFHSSPRRDMTLLRLGAAIRTATTLLHSNGETSSGA